MGIAAEVKAKSAGALRRDGRHHRRQRRCEIGFQQVSELVHIPGIDYIGPLPADVQCITVFSCGLQTGAPQPDAAKALVAFLTTPAAGLSCKSMARNGLIRLFGFSARTRLLP